MRRKRTFVPLFRPIFALFLVVSILGVAGCASRGNEVNPIERKFQWFSYLNGDDIRSQCKVGSPNQYRFVYNGVYTEQVRTYDLKGHELAHNVIGEANLRELYVNKLSDLLKPWQGKKAKVILRDADIALLEKAMASDGLFKRGLEEKELSSDDFYWLVLSCREGEFNFNSFRWPAKGFDQLAFSSLLKIWDMTEIPFNPPRETTYHDQYPHSEQTRIRFNIRVSSDGLMYLP